MSSESSGKGCFPGILGAIIGAGIGGLPGGIIGFFAGSLIWNGISKSNSGAKTPRNANAGNRQAHSANNPENNPFIVACFSLLAKMAKADGVVSIEEAEVIKRHIYALFETEEERQSIKRIFNSARDDGRSFESYCTYFAQIIPDAGLRQCTMNLLCEIAAADGVLKQEELRCLRFAETVFNLQGYVNSFFHLNSSSDNQDNSRYRQQNAEPDSENLDFCYRVLGVSAGASDNEVKKAYREKCRQCHPDILRAKGLPENMLKKAECEMQRINAAYDRICRYRNHKN